MGGSCCCVVVDFESFDYVEFKFQWTESTTVDRWRIRARIVVVKRRESGGLLLRAVAAAKNTRRGTLSSSLSISVAALNGNTIEMESDGEMLTCSSLAGEEGGIDARP